METLQEIDQLVSQLTAEEQQALLVALRRQLLLRRAEQLDRSVRPSPLRMEDIVEEVWHVRQQRHAA